MEVDAHSVVWFFMSACTQPCGPPVLGILALPLEQVVLLMKLIAARSLIIFSNFIQRRNLF